MAAPTFKYAYLNYARTHVIVVIRVDHANSPLKILGGGSATNGWTVRKGGIAQSILGTMAEPRPNTVSLALDSALSVTESLTVEYTSVSGDTGDQLNQELVTFTAVAVLDALPIIDLIARDIKMRLEDITTANGFLSNLTVNDDLKTPLTLAKWLAQVSYDDPVPEDDAPLNHEQFTASFSIPIPTAVLTTSSTPLSAEEFKLEGEVTKYLQVDYSRNNLAVDTIPATTTRVEFDGGGGWGGISVNMTVRFRTLYGDRFNQ